MGKRKCQSCESRDGRFISSGQTVGGLRCTCCVGKHARHTWHQTVCGGFGKALTRTCVCCWLGSTFCCSGCMIFCDALFFEKKSVSLVYRDVWTTVTSFGKTGRRDLGKPQGRTFATPPGAREESDTRWCRATQAAAPLMRNP
jgi:hypothetical protein